MRVQVQARSVLVAYRLSGYRSSKDGEPPVEGKSLKTEEPPLADTPVGLSPSERPSYTTVERRFPRSEIQ